MSKKSKIKLLICLLLSFIIVYGWIFGGNNAKKSTIEWVKINNGTVKYNDWIEKLPRGVSRIVSGVIGTSVSEIRFDYLQNPIKNLTPLKNVLEIQSLTLFLENYDNIEVLRLLTNLEYLAIRILSSDDLDLTSFQKLSNLVNLRLEITSEKEINLLNLKALETCSKLKSLILMLPAKVNLAEIKDLNTITHMALFVSSITNDESIFKHFPNLKNLRIKDGLLSLSQIKKLKSDYLPNCNVEIVVLPY